MRTIPLCIQGVTEKSPYAYRDAKIPVCIRGLVYIRSLYAYRDAKIAVCIRGLPPRLSSALEMRKVINLGKNFQMPHLIEQYRWLTSPIRYVAKNRVLLVYYSLCLILRVSTEIYLFGDPFSVLSKRAAMSEKRNN